MEYTNGWKVIEIHYKGNQSVGFVKCTRKGVITVQVKSDIGCKPADEIQLGIDTYIVQKVYLTQHRSEITCVDTKSDLKKAIKTKKKLKKALGESEWYQPTNTQEK